MMRELLIVARNYPPTSHVSVERVMKLVKYLPRYGWQPTVLTGTKPMGRCAEDPTLLRQVEHAEVLRAYALDPADLFAQLTALARGQKPVRPAAGQRSFRAPGPWHPKSLLIPDSQLLWVPVAVRAAMRAATRHRWRVVLAMTPPASTILVADRIARRLGIPFVIDYRDPWTTYYAGPNRLARLAAYEGRLEARLFRRARAIITTNPSFVELPAAAAPADARPPIHVVDNGYDEEDFAGLTQVELPEFSIVNVGSLRFTLRPLWTVLHRALTAMPTLRDRLHFWQVGAIGTGVRPQLAEAPEGVVVHTVAHLPQREAIRYMLGADLLFIEGVRDLVPSKTFQYLRAGRPILALLDTGTALRDVVQLVSHGQAFTSDEFAAAADMVVRLAAAPRAAPAPLSPRVTCHARHEIARRVAAILATVASEVESSRGRDALR